MKKASLILMFLIALSFSCGPAITEGRRMDASKIRSILQDSATKEEVTEKLGKPAKIEKLFSGRERYLYRFYKEEYTHWWTPPLLEKQEVELTFKNGVVQGYRYSSLRRDEITDKDWKLF